MRLSSTTDASRGPSVMAKTREERDSLLYDIWCEKKKYKNFEEEEGENFSFS